MPSDKISLRNLQYFGISIPQCAQLANIAALNSNTFNIDGTSTGSSGSVNNGQEFFNQCSNSGISVLQYGQLLNVAILNGNAVNIALGGLASLIFIGIPTTLLSGILPTATGLLPMGFSG